MKFFVKKTLTILFLIGIGYNSPAFAQSARDLNNKGVEQYKKGEFADAEASFKKSADAAPKNFITNFNLGDAFYKQKNYSDAIKAYQSALTETKNKNEQAEIYHNIGNSLLKNNKIKESIAAYKQSLKLNPDDSDTKYNLSYALSLLKNQNKNKNQDKNNKNDKQNNKNKDQKNNQNQNKDQKNNKDQQNKQNQKNQDQKKDQQQNQQQKNKDQQRPDQKNQQAQQDNLKQPDKNKISKAEAQRILEALKNNEKDLQKKLRKQVGKPTKTGKDW